MSLVKGSDCLGRLRQVKRTSQQEVVYRDSQDTVKTYLRYLFNTTGRMLTVEVSGNEKDAGKMPTLRNASIKREGMRREILAVSTYYRMRNKA